MFLPSRAGQLPNRSPRRGLASSRSAAVRQMTPGAPSVWAAERLPGRPARWDPQGSAGAGVASGVVVRGARLDLVPRKPADHLRAMFPEHPCHGAHVAVLLAKVLQQLFAVSRLLGAQLA